jgi:hypothetical protein
LVWVACAHGHASAADERGVRGEKADRPGAEDQHLVAGADVGEMRRVDADGERFREHREVEIEPGRHAIEEPRRYLDHLREAARRHAAENTDLRAEVRLAAATACAGAAREQRLDDDAVPRRETAARSGHTADDLVPETHLRGRRHPRVVMEVGAADPAGVDAHDRRLGGRARCRHVAHRYRSWRGTKRSLHGAAHSIAGRREKFAALPSALPQRMRCARSWAKIFF